MLVGYHRGGKPKANLALSSGKEVQYSLNRQKMASLKWLKQT